MKINEKEAHFFFKKIIIAMPMRPDWAIFKGLK